MKQISINIKNKRAVFDYEIIDTYTAGIVLTGTEIKSIRIGKAGLSDTFCYFLRRELWVKNMYIAEYFYGSYNNHTARSDRKLLLNRKELKKLERAVKETGLTIVPVRMFLNEKGLVKVVIALVRGKKLYDKRQSLKEKDDRRDMDRMLKRPKIIP
ncbi:SsrA-binding protein [termite gut metagenome]|uniref:SsrA-binding protein n=1 Tax=termite gut metagenome TaxID=433724 RepID=A0A5J4SGP4_9ZZZZ